MCTILVPWTTIYLTKVTALMAKRFEYIVGSHANQARSDKLVSTSFYIFTNETLFMFLAHGLA